MARCYQEESTRRKQIGESQSDLTMNLMSRFLIGIDLGTTNSAVAYIDLSAARSGRGSAPPVQIFDVPQLIAPGELKPRPLLPSFLYLPGPHDLPAGAVALPWDADCAY